MLALSSCWTTRVSSCGAISARSCMEGWEATEVSRICRCWSGCPADNIGDRPARSGAHEGNRAAQKGQGTIVFFEDSTPVDAVLAKMPT